MSEGLKGINAFFIVDMYERIKGWYTGMKMSLAAIALAGVTACASPRIHEPADSSDVVGMAEIIQSMQTRIAKTNFTYSRELEYGETYARKSHIGIIDYGHEAKGLSDLDILRLNDTSMGTRKTLNHGTENTRKAARAVATGYIKSYAGKEAEVSGTTLVDVGYLPSAPQSIDSHVSDQQKQPSIPWHPFALAGFMGLANVLLVIFALKRMKQTESVQPVEVSIPYTGMGAQKFNGIEILEVKVSDARPYQK